MRLAVRITSVGIVFSSVIIGVLLLVAVLGARAGLVESIGVTQVQLAESVMGEIDRVLYERLLDVQAMAEDEEFEGVLSGDDVVGSQEKLDELLFLTGPWDELEVFDVAGVVVASSNDGEVGEGIDEQGVHERLVFDAVVSSGEVFVSDVVVSDESGRPTMIFAAPVRSDGLGRPVVGVVMGNFAWQVVLDVLQEQRVEAHLYNGEGVLIGDSGAFHEGVVFGDMISSGNVAFQHAVKGESVSVVLEKSVTGDAHHGDVLSAHVPQLGYLGFRGHGWVLILETPADVAFAPVKTTTRNLLLAGLLVLVGTVLLWFFVARSISGPVLRLRDAALRISRGNFGESVVVRSDDEIGELADAFDNMRYSLQMVIGEYEVMRGGKKKKGVQPIAGIDRSVEKKVKKKGGKVGSKK